MCKNIKRTTVTDIMQNNCGAAVVSQNLKDGFLVSWCKGDCLQYQSQENDQTGLCFDLDQLKSIPSSYKHEVKDGSVMSPVCLPFFANIIYG